MSKAKQYLELFRQTDQNNIQRELSLFFGLRADVYLHTYKKYREKTLAKNKLSLPLTWHWGAFFAPFVWLSYRRLYLYLLFVVVLVVAFAATAIWLNEGRMPSGSAGGLAVFAILGKAMYVQEGLNRIIKANRLQLSGKEREDYLQRTGGVSLVAGIITGVVMAIVIGIPIYELITTGRISTR